MNRLISGAILTIVIGGTAFTFSQADVVKHFAEDTGLTQEQANEYVSNVKDDELVPYNELGSDYVADGQEVLNLVAGIDCVNYRYEWESANLTCYTGKTQMSKFGRDEIALGEAYIQLGSESASRDDMSKTIQLIDAYNSDFDLKVIDSLYSQSEISEFKKNSSFNKAVLKAALESKQ